MVCSPTNSASVALTVSFIALACADAHGDETMLGDHLTSEDQETGATCPLKSTLSYESFGRPFMEAYCTRCHDGSERGTAREGAPLDQDFDTLNGILAADHIDEHAAAGPDAVNTEMPPSAPRPSEEERWQLGEWLACERLRRSDAGAAEDDGHD